MKIVVLVKEVPDTYGDRKLNLETGLADRGASEAVLDEIGERAIEVALSYADANAGSEVVVLDYLFTGLAATARNTTVWLRVGDQWRAAHHQQTHVS